MFIFLLLGIKNALVVSSETTKAFWYPLNSSL